MGCSTIAKCLFMLINVLFLVVSIALIAVGAILAFVPGPIFSSILDAAKSAAASANANIPNTVDDIKNIPMAYEIGLAFFVFGIFLFIISFLGCCGGCCSCCKFMLILYAIIMVLLMIGEIVIVTMFFMRNSPLHDTIRSKLKDKITNDFDENGSDSFSQIINLINYNFECCGIDGVADFGTKVHNSCQSNTIGCYTKVNNIIQDNIVYAGEAFAALLLFQLIQVIFAVVLFKKQNKISPF
ncbi:hypothetical protein Btru_021096 [Bulinus truncatus]|nr:hypothetical protein Btru_021096 [Bulinus truncatus]